MNAIVLMAIGAKYEAILQETRDQFERYAEKCGAILEICRTPPDPSMQGHLLTQKMLIPKVYKQYEWIAFLDLDVVISKHAPSIFDNIDNTKGFGAVLDPIGEKVFFKTNHYWFNRAPNNITSIDDRFINEGFEFNPRIKGIINGGIWVANPKIVGELFAEYYHEHENKLGFFEEISMSFLTQDSELFFPLDRRFNDQLIYFSCKENARFNYLTIKLQKKINQVLNRVIPKRVRYLFLQPYISLIEKTLDSSFILHFSGGYPIPKELKNSLGLSLKK